VEASGDVSRNSFEDGRCFGGTVQLHQRDGDVESQIRRSIKSVRALEMFERKGVLSARRSLHSDWVSRLASSRVESSARAGVKEDSIIIANTAMRAKIITMKVYQKCLGNDGIGSGIRSNRPDRRSVASSQPVLLCDPHSHGGDDAPELRRF